MKISTADDLPRFFAAFLEQFLNSTQFYVILYLTD